METVLLIACPMAFNTISLTRLSYKKWKRDILNQSRTDSFSADSKHMLRNMNKQGGKNLFIRERERIYK